MQDHDDMLSSSDAALNMRGGAGWAEEEMHVNDERRALARELHDTVVQPLTALLMSFTCLERLPQRSSQVDANIGLWRDLAQEALDSLRSALAGLHIHAHGELTLPDALEQHLAPRLSSSGLRLVVERHNWPTDLPADCTSNLYLLVREALTNVEKHACATTVAVVLRADTEGLSISVTDNGIGCRADDLILKDSPDRHGSGLGVNGMRERARMLGGRLDLVTVPGCGVQLDIRVPIPEGVHVESLSLAEVVNTIH
jgi:signal transduction histidine kinase